MLPGPGIEADDPTTGVASSPRLTGPLCGGKASSQFDQLEDFRPSACYPGQALRLTNASGGHHRPRPLICSRTPLIRPNPGVGTPPEGRGDLIAADPGRNASGGHHRPRPLICSRTPLIRPNPGVGTPPEGRAPTGRRGPGRPAGRRDPVTARRQRRVRRTGQAGGAGRGGRADRRRGAGDRAGRRAGGIL